MNARPDTKRFERGAVARSGERITHIVFSPNPLRPLAKRPTAYLGSDPVESVDDPGSAGWSATLVQNWTAARS
jgi:hypothetical protein